MVWFHVDPNLTFHPKVVAAGNAATGVWVRAGAYCVQALTDGFIPDKIARQLGTQVQFDRLTSCDMMERVTGGYLMHQWHERQASKQDIESKRKSWRETKANQRKPKNVLNGHPQQDSHESPPEGISQESNESPYTTSTALSVVTLGENSPVGSRPAEQPPPPSGGPPAPNQFCEKHMPFGTDENCAACGRYRIKYEKWMAQQTLDTKRQIQENGRAERAKFYATINQCNLCDDDGYRLPDCQTICDHVDRKDIAARGRAAVNAALAKKNTTTEMPF